MKKLNTDYFISVSIKSDNFKEAIENMSADIFINQENDNWTVKIMTNVKEKSITLFVRDNCKHEGTANTVMDGAWNKLKKKYTQKRRK